MSPAQYFLPLHNALIEEACEEKASGMAKYMRNQFPFLGISTPIRRGLLKDFLRNNPSSPLHYTEIVKWCWQQPHREWQYIGVDYLSSIPSKWDNSLLGLCETLIIQKSWWDSVDLLSSNVAGKFLLKTTVPIEPIIMRWNASPNRWLNRASIIFQLHWKDKTDTQILTHCIITHMASKDFFHQKAIGWALRQYARTNPQWVREFIVNYPLSPLSKREAAKHL